MSDSDHTCMGCGQLEGDTHKPGCERYTSSPIVQEKDVHHVPAPAPAPRPKPGTNNYQGPGVYRHYKGGLYHVLGLAVREETVAKPGEDHNQIWPKEGVTVVVYEPMTEGSLLECRAESFWTRDIDDFNRQIDGVARFVKVDAPLFSWRVNLQR